MHTCKRQPTICGLAFLDGYRNSGENAIQAKIRVSTMQTFSTTAPRLVPVLIRFTRMRHLSGGNGRIPRLVSESANRCIAYAVPPATQISGPCCWVVLYNKPAHIAVPYRVCVSPYESVWCRALTNCLQSSSTVRTRDHRKPAQVQSQTSTLCEANAKAGMTRAQ